MARAVVAALAAALAVATCAAKKPHMFLMMADQLRFDAVSLYGSDRPHTPSLDALGKDGVAFHAFSSTPTCTPARSGLLTGNSPWGHGMLGYGTVAPEYPYEMPTTMAAGGYETIAIGKDHFGWNATTNEGIAHGFKTRSIYDGLGNGLPSSNDTNGFDTYDQWFQKQMPGKDPMATGLDWNTWHGKAYVYPEQYHPTAWVGQSAVDLIDLYDFDDPDAAPLFLKLSWHRPHSPYDPPARLLNASIARDKLPEIHTCNSTSDGAWDMRFEGTQGAPPGCGPTTDAWCGLMPVNETFISRHAYQASVSFVDEWVGKVIAALKRRGVYDESVILWTADHGDGQGDHYHWRKGFPYEFSSHVPMMLKWPESENSIVPRGTVLSPGPVTELRDVFPTFADYGSAPGPAPGVAPPNGQSLRCLLHKSPEACGWREYVDLEHNVCYNFTNHWSALADSGTKYVYRAFFGDEQLFNTTADPYELVDLSKDPAYASELELWRSRMVKQFETEGRGPAWVKDGKLVPRPQSINYGPNYPLPPAPRPHARLMLETCVNNDAAPLNQSMLWSLDESGSFSTLRLLWSSPTDGELCVNATAPEGAVDVARCSGDARGPQAFRMASDHRGQIVHEASGLCLAVHDSRAVAGTHVQLSTCDQSDAQNWTLGLSGRVFSKLSAGLCMTANQPKWAGLFKDFVSAGGLASAPTSNAAGLPAP